MAGMGPWGPEESWELNETKFDEKDIIRNGRPANEGDSHIDKIQNGSKLNGKNQNGQNGRSKNGTRVSISNQSGRRCDGRENGAGRNIADKVSIYALPGTGI